ncbi:MAG: SDR family oxidoreductase [Gammaproteobacteria bacterium]|nr:SDR family oxidoreductase [Gammaproteobacteria bacterium]
MSQVIVITGSTRGIGYGLAAEFLKRGHSVVVTGRSGEAVGRATAELGRFGTVLGQVLDVRSLAANQATWDAAVARFGRVDMWIANAGVATDHVPFAELPDEQIAATLDTNLAGTLYGTRVALAGMLKQGGGRIYTFEGFGSNDMMKPGIVVYGTTKRAIRYFTRALAKECAGTPVLIGSLSPGMVPTDLLVYSSRGNDPVAWARAKRIMNILADRVEDVTPWLVEQALANTKQGASIEWLTRPRAFGRFLLAPFRRRDLISAIEARANVVVR